MASESLLIPQARIRYERGIFELPTVSGKLQNKYSCHFLIPKDDAQLVQQVRARIDDFARQNNAGKTLSAEKLCFRSGEDLDEENDYITDYYRLSAANPSRPYVLSSDGKPISQSDNIIASGVWVQALVSFWWQTPKAATGQTKRVNCNLLMVRFVKYDDPFPSAGVSAEDTIREYNKQAAALGLDPLADPQSNATATPDEDEPW